MHITISANWPVTGFERTVSQVSIIEDAALFTCKLPTITVSDSIYYDSFCPQLLSTSDYDFRIVSRTRKSREGRYQFVAVATAAP